MTKRRKQRKDGYTPVDKHSRTKSVLVAPINQLPVQAIMWERDLLPEHLWLELLFHTYHRRLALDLYKRFVESLQPYCPQGEVMYGYISDFGLIPAEQRSEYLRQNEALVESAFRKPFSHIVSLYPDAPCSWLVTHDGNTNKDEAIQHLSESILRLLPGKDLYAGDIRVLPFRQLLQQGKFFFQSGMHIVDLLPKYPELCTEQEQYEVQQHVRIFMNATLQRLSHHKDHNWPRYFWRHNFELVKCFPYQVSPGTEEQIDSNHKDKIQELATTNSDASIAYLNEVAEAHFYDLYDPTRDEILLGLFSRLTRLYSMTTTIPPLWAPDMAGIMLRCLADTAITFAYLAKCGTPSEFGSFVSYGEGKEKLLMLHLQDRYPTAKSFEGMTSEDIANELGGGFMPELININLADWTNKSARDLAFASGMDEIYRLVYDPASTHLHGTWMSIQRTNLVRCIQPMHRFHRIPEFFEPPLYVNMLDSFSRIYETAVQVGIEKLNFPPEKPLVKRIQVLYSELPSSKVKKKD